MPRRPRPATRAPPTGAPPKTALKRPRDESEPLVESDFGEGSNIIQDNDEDSSAPDEDDNIAEDSDDGDADKPRVVQWQDDDENDWQDEEPQAGSSTSSAVQKDLSSLSLGSLRNAQRTLLQAEAVDSSDDEDAPPKPSQSKGKQKEVEWSANPQPVIQARTSKHAPVEVTSKRPVSRKRTVVEVKTIQPRDPRFLPLSGEFSEEKYQKNYSFLSDAHKAELHTLRENLKRAKKLLESSPKNLRSEREEEVSKLELALKRAESDVNKDKRTHIERIAMERVKKEEKEKRQQGKGSWYMKDSEKKTLLAKARYDALATSGGERAVKKAIEKKQKKIGQKEKRSRPFGRPNAPRGGEERPAKRRRFN